MARLETTFFSATDFLSLGIQPSYRINLENIGTELCGFPFNVDFSRCSTCSNISPYTMNDEEKESIPRMERACEAKKEPQKQRNIRLFFPSLAIC